MAQIEQAAEGVKLTLSADELLIITNALAAVCHAVRVAEADFPSLIGVTRNFGGRCTLGQA